MKCENFEQLIRYIYTQIMENDYEKYLEISYSEDEIIMTVFENEIPIRIHFENVVFAKDNSVREMLTAEVYTELCRCNIGKGWLSQLDKICSLIEDNEHIFKKLMGKEKQND